MAISRMLVFLIFMVSLAEISGSAQPECHIDVIDAIAGKTFIIGTWSLNNATLSITVKRGDTIRLSYFFNERDTKLAQDREGRLLLKLDNVTTEVSLMFETVGREDEGLYGMKIFFRGVQSDRYGRKDGEYTFQLNVIEKNEVTQGCEGDNISRELETTPESFFLYRYDKTIATVMKSVCWVSEESIVYGRLRCNSKNDRYTISINNATQLDTGLYKIQDPMNSSGIQRWFFNISDKPTHANIGDNVVISWFYNQPGINCTIRVIHPYEGAIMLVPSNNVAQIRSNVRHRLLYSGDVSRNYMSFTLLNVIASDGGFYTIESLYETIISGRKLLTVKANITTMGLNTESIHTSVTDVPLDYDSSDIPKSEKDTNAAVNESSTQIRISTSTSPSANILVFVIPVVIGVVVVVLLMIGCLIRIQQKNAHSLEEVERILLEKCDAASFATPSTIRRHLPTPPTQAERTDHWLQEPNSDQIRIVGLHYAAIPMNPLSVYKECSGIVSLETMEYKKPGIRFTERIENCDKFIHASNNTITDTYYEDGEDLLDDHLFSAVNAEHNLIDDAYSQIEKERSTRVKDLHLEDNKSRIFASETKRTWNPHKSSMSGTSEEGGYEMFEGVINIASEAAVKISDGTDVLMVENEGPKQEEMRSDAEYNDYEVINLQ